MLQVVTPPVLPVVTTVEAKRHLHVDFDDDDLYIDSLVEAAVANLNGPAGWLGISLRSQVLMLTLDRFPCGRGLLNIPLPPLVSVDLIEYTDLTGGSATYLGHRARGVGASFGGYILPAAAENWPSTYCEPGAVRITFTAGYAAVPKSIKQAILLMVAHWYENREETSAIKLVNMPTAAKSLLMPHRCWR
ncbi:MAG: head-tail connector protein [Xanthobacteraceae bacterium]